MNHENLLLDQLKDSIKSEVKKYLSALSREELGELSIFFGEERRKLIDMSLGTINECFDEGLPDNDNAELDEDQHSTFIDTIKYLD